MNIISVSILADMIIGHNFTGYEAQKESFEDYLLSPESWGDRDQRMITLGYLECTNDREILEDARTYVNDELGGDADSMTALEVMRAYLIPLFANAASDALYMIEEEQAA